jgi:hyperosmotically inducible periplasmic protein
MKVINRMLLAMGMLLLGNASLWAYQTDQGIESSISNSYVFSNYLRGDNIAVHSQGGIVTLTGTVADENHKFLAQNTAENLPEVKSVDNELQIKEPLPAEYTDAWIGLKVKAVLLFHSNVSAVSTKVDVKDGIVTLSGDAGSAAQKELTAEYAKDINGVKGVINNMDIKRTGEVSSQRMGSTIDDASITAQIKLTLLMHQSTSAIHTHVKTEKGVVTLTGTASSGAEKSLVTKLVSDINGVKNVINDMDVQP